MIDPSTGVLTLLWGGSVDAQTVQLEEVRSVLTRHMEALGEMIASLESMERMPLVLETGKVLMPVTQARVHAEAAARALHKLLAEP